MLYYSCEDIHTDTFCSIGQVAGLSSTEFGLSQMIWAAVVIGKDGDYTITQVGMFKVLLI